MKLEQIAGLAVTIGSMLALSGCACGSHAAQTAVPKPQVATTQLMAAELTEADNAPHVGKSQHSMASKGDAFEASDDKDAPRRDERRHNGGGFSGWK